MSKRCSVPANYITNFEIKGESSEIKKKKEKKKENVEFKLIIQGVEDIRT